MKQQELIAGKFHKLVAQFPHLLRTLRLVWRAAPRWTALWLLLLTLNGILPAVTVTLTREVVDSLVAALEGPPTWEDVRPALLLIALMAAVILLSEMIRSLSNWIRTAQAEQVKDYLSGLIHQRAAAIDLGFYESPTYYDTLYRARFDAQNRPVALLENLGTLLQNTITLVAMAAVLLPFGWWLPLALLLSTLPAFYVVLDYTVRQHRWRMQMTEAERKSSYYNWLLTGRESAAELRLFDLSGHFQTLFQGLRRQIREGRVALARQQGLAELAASASALLVTGAVLAWMVWRAVQGFLSLGDLALFYQAFNQGQRLMRSLLESVGQIYSNVLFVENLFEFLELESRIVDPPQPATLPTALERGISLENVSFRYPGSERYALRDFNLEVPAGQVAAIVGANGAGKSTLIKLLCRFYDPDEGRVRLDGHDLRTLRVDEVQRLITVLFQEPVHYNATAAENIAYGDLAVEPTEGEIRRAARAAGADEPIRRLPQEYDSLLGKWFAGGHDLSVGEWQRLSLARAFLRQAELIVLDEPTSAMDSWAETDWLNRFRALADGRTAIIITHRFTTAMRADVIHVMEDGQVVESGTHEELLSMGGRYAQSWRAQVEEHTAMRYTEAISRGIKA